jgi:ribosomal protein L37AE/L43A
MNDQHQPDALGPCQSCGGLLTRIGLVFYCCDYCETLHYLVQGDMKLLSALQLKPFVPQLRDERHRIARRIEKLWPLQESLHFKEKLRTLIKTRDRLTRMIELAYVPARLAAAERLGAVNYFADLRGIEPPEVARINCPRCGGSLERAGASPITCPYCGQAHDPVEWNEPTVTAAAADRNEVVGNIAVLEKILAARRAEIKLDAGGRKKSAAAIERLEGAIRASSELLPKDDPRPDDAVLLPSACPACSDELFRIGNALYCCEHCRALFRPGMDDPATLRAIKFDPDLPRAELGVIYTKIAKQQEKMSRMKWQWPHVSWSNSPRAADRDFSTARRELEALIRTRERLERIIAWDEAGDDRAGKDK